MKKIIFALLAVILLSCSNDSNDVSLATTKWKFKMDGVQYEWSGDSSDPMSFGSSLFSQQNSATSIELFSVLDPSISFNFVIPTLNKGTYILDNANAYLTNYSGSIVSYYTSSSYKITLNITEINNDVTPNKIIGTFSGKLVRENSSGATIVKNITEGYLEAVRE